MSPSGSIRLLLTLSIGWTLQDTVMRFWNHRLAMSSKLSTSKFTLLPILLWAIADMSLVFITQGLSSWTELIGVSKRRGSIPLFPQKCIHTNTHPPSWNQLALEDLLIDAQSNLFHYSGLNILPQSVRCRKALKRVTLQGKSSLQISGPQISQPLWLFQHGSSRDIISMNLNFRYHYCYEESRYNSPS